MAIGRFLAQAAGVLRRGNSKAEDPVCRMSVDSGSPPGGSWEYQGTTYRFCAPGCNREFQKEPEAYLTGKKKLDM